MASLPLLGGSTSNVSQAPACRIGAGDALLYTHRMRKARDMLRCGMAMHPPGGPRPDLPPSAQRLGCSRRHAGRSAATFRLTKAEVQSSGCWPAPQLAGEPAETPRTGQIIPGMRAPNQRDLRASCRVRWSSAALPGCAAMPGYIAIVTQNIDFGPTAVRFAPCC